MYLLEALKRLVARSRRQAEAVRPAEVHYFHPKPPQAPELPAPPSEAPPVELLRPPTPPGVPPQAPLEGLGDFLKTGAGDLAQLGRTAVKVTELAEDLLDKGLGAGEGRARLVTVGGAPTAVAVASAQLARKGLEALGVTDEKLIKPLEQAAAFPVLAPSIFVMHAASAALRTFSPEADAFVRGGVKKLDFTDEKQPAGALAKVGIDALKGALSGKPVNVESAVQTLAAAFTPKPVVPPPHPAPPTAEFLASLQRNVPPPPPGKKPLEVVRPGPVVRGGTKRGDP